MDAELTALELRIRQAADLCRRLREDNDNLRANITVLETEKGALLERIESARERLETLLKQIPDQG